MSRKFARKHALAMIFQIDFSDIEEMPEKLVDYLSTVEDLSETEFAAEEVLTVADRSFIKEELEGVLANKDAIDELIGKYSEGWALDRLSKVDLSVLRLAVYEMLYAEGIPEGVAINEAVELAKIYSGDQSPAFINGILGNISREVTTHTEQG